MLHCLSKPLAAVGHFRCQQCCLHFLPTGLLSRPGYSAVLRAVLAARQLQVHCQKSLQLPAEEALCWGIQEPEVSELGLGGSGCFVHGQVSLGPQPGVCQPAPSACMLLLVLPKLDTKKGAARKPADSEDTALEILVEGACSDTCLSCTHLTRLGAGLSSKVEVSTCCLLACMDLQVRSSACSLL